MLTAIFGGTFNPLHNGHYEILKSLNNDSEVGKILLMPDRLPPHKSAEALIDDQTRIEMCKIAAEDFSKCELCLIEFEREGKSYTYDTVKLLKKRYKNEKLAFVIGGDMLVYFDKWWKYKKLMKMLTFIVFKRTATDVGEFDACIERFKKEGMEIILKNAEITNVSSTDLRNDFSLSEKLLPDKVYEFLKQKGVYNG